MEHLKKSENNHADQHLAHPLIIKMGGRQWVVGGENAIPVEVGKTEKLISLSTWSAVNPLRAESTPAENKPRLSQWVAGYLDKLSTTLDGLLGFRRTDAHEGNEVSAKNGATLQALRENLAVSKVRRSLRDTFQFGLTLGLAMGCLSVFLFHQLEPNHVYISGSPSNQTSTVLTGLSPGFTLPSVKLYTLQSSPFASEKEAVNAQSELNKLGIFTVVHGTQTYTLWCSMAIHNGALKSLKDNLAKAGLKAAETKVEWNAQTIAGPSGESQSTASQVSRWLSASVSSLTTLTGVLSDGGVDRDATQAYATEKSLRPTADVLASTGYEKELNELVRDMDAAMTEYQKKNHDKAMNDVVHACVALSNIQMSATSFNSL
jgi:hypothetical protein